MKCDVFVTRLAVLVLAVLYSALMERFEAI